MSPGLGAYRLLPHVQGVAAKNILFVGVESLRDFGYQQIRVFAKKVLSSLSNELPDMRRLAITIHGPGYGLDEDEAFKSELAGFLDALSESVAPENLELITIVDRDEKRVLRLQSTLNQIIAKGTFARDGKHLPDTVGHEARERLGTVGYSSASKGHVFVAMPFSEEFEDVYHYGIRNAVRKADLLCERADLSAFTGDVIAWVRDRIRTANLVVADLSGANANVYLEVGFAWGCGIPAILLIDDPKNLCFNTQGQRCLVYKKIQDLEKQLSEELAQLIRLDNSGQISDRHRTGQLAP
jgi:hypothetical protein